MLAETNLFHTYTKAAGKVLIIIYIPQKKVALKNDPPESTRVLLVLLNVMAPKLLQLVLVALLMLFRM